MPRQVLGIGHPNLIIKAMQDNQQEGGYEFKSQPANLEGATEWHPIHCTLEKDYMFASFSLQQMPGCCAVLVLSYIHPKPYTQENMDEVIKIVEQAASDAGFGSVMMTQVVPAFSKMFWSKEPWIRCLDREWVASPPFRNAKSGNLVTCLSKNMNQPNKKLGFEVPIYEE